MPLAAAWLQSCVAERMHQVQMQPVTPSHAQEFSFWQPGRSRAAQHSPTGL